MREGLGFVSHLAESWCVSPRLGVGVVACGGGGDDGGWTCLHVYLFCFLFTCFRC